jgi:N-acetylneuraminic acid mutarotase
MKVGLLLIFLSLSTFAKTQNVWIQRDSVNGPPRGGAAAFTLQNEGYLIGGIDLIDFKRKLYSYDTEQDDWDDETSLGGDAGAGLERASAVAFTIDTFGYVGLGIGGTLLKDLWRYDAASGTWTQMADFAGSARNGAIGFAIDQKGYVGLGQDADNLKSDFYSYDPSLNEWQELTDFEGGARKEAVGFTMGGKGYVGTGRANTGYLADFWEYDPLTDSWEQKADFPGTPRLGAVGCGVFPNAYIMLGEDNDFEYRKDVWSYNYFGDVWSQRADFPHTRTQASALVIDNRIFVGLGYNGQYHDDFYEYEPYPLSTSEFDAADFNLYPNPTNTHFRVDTPMEISNPQIRIFSVSGQEITGLMNIEKQGDGRHFISCDEKIVSGQYFVCIYHESNFIASKSVVFN